MGATCCAPRLSDKIELTDPNGIVVEEVTLHRFPLAAFSLKNAEHCISLPDEPAAGTASHSTLLALFAHPGSAASSRPGQRETLSGSTLNAPVMISPQSPTSGAQRRSVPTRSSPSSRSLPCKGAKKAPPMPQPQLASLPLWPEPSTMGMSMTVLSSRLAACRKRPHTPCPRHSPKLHARVVRDCGRTTLTVHIHKYLVRDIEMNNKGE
jgi:hypothetical protein